MLTFLSCIDSSLRPRSTTPYWPQGIRVCFFFLPHPPPPAPGQKPCRAEPRTHAGASSRWQQRAAAPPALPSRKPTSWMASSQVSPGSPWHPRTRTTSGIHEPLSGARAGASGSQSWPRGGSRGGSLLRRPGGDVLPPPLPPCGPHPLRAPQPAGWDNARCARAGSASPATARGSGPRFRGRGTRVLLACPSSLFTCPARPLAFKASGSSPDGEGPAGGERT